MLVIGPVYARVVAREVKRRGLPPAPLFEGTALDADVLESGADILAEDFNRLLVNASRMTGDPEFGLVIGRNSNILALGPVGTAMVNAPTLREGLRILESFTRLHSSYTRVSLRSTLQGLTLGVDFLETAGEAGRFHVETGFQVFQHYIEMIQGEALISATFRFNYAAPDYAGAYAGLYHGRCEFGAPENSVEISRAGLDAPSPFYHPDIWLREQQQLSRRLRQMTSREEATYTRHVHALMRSSEPPLPDLQAVAAGLHMSDRTLNRRLKEENTSFRDIRSGALHSWAQRYLSQTGLTVEAIAASLGYQDAANFRRAFKAREGISPGAYREAASA